MPKNLQRIRFLFAFSTNLNLLVSFDGTEKYQTSKKTHEKNSLRSFFISLAPHLSPKTNPLLVGYTDELASLRINN